MAKKKKKSSWVKYFLGTPQRAMWTATVCMGIAAMNAVFPGALQGAIVGLIQVVAPWAVIGFGLWIAVKAVRTMVGL